MSFVDIVLGPDQHGAAVILITSIKPSILKQWVLALDTCTFTRFLVRRLKITPERTWWLICFEVLNLWKLMLSSVLDICDFFFHSTILSGWHPDVVLETDKMLGLCGNAEQKGCAATDGDYELIAEFMGFERRTLERKRQCLSEFREYLREDLNFASIENMRTLARKYSFFGGKWLIFTVDEEPNVIFKKPEKRQSPNCIYRSIEIARNLWAAIFDGTIDSSHFIDNIDLHNYRSSSVVSVSNRYTTTSLENNPNGCLHNDEDVKTVLEEISLLVSMDNNVLLKYKPEIYSVCNIHNGNGLSLKPTIYTATWFPSKLGLGCDCGAFHKSSAKD